MLEAGGFPPEGTLPRFWRKLALDRKLKDREVCSELAVGPVEVRDLLEAPAPAFIEQGG